jgi:hypothetical protein
MCPTSALLASSCCLALNVGKNSILELAKKENRRKLKYFMRLTASYDRILYFEISLLHQLT